MHEATFRLAGTSDLARLTETFDARVSLWCNDHSDFLWIRCRPTDTAPILEVLDGIIGVEESLVDGGEIIVVTKTCIKATDGTTVDAHLDEHGCLLLPPLQYESGARLCRVLAIDAQRLTALYHSLLEEFSVTVDAKIDLETAEGVSPFDLGGQLPPLTTRQRQVFTLALENGYYDIPRETSMEAIAAELGIDRRTAEEHRRRAESKLLGALAAAHLL